MPTIASGSSVGFAGTWVAAEAPSVTPHGSPDIQVGTNEERRSPSPGRPYDVYSAFWTDNVHSFYPQSLFAVRPGDDISASLTLSHHRWAVAIRDATSGARSRFLTSDETQASFNEAQWIQEDRMFCSEHTKSCPYPRLSTVRFGQLAVISPVPAMPTCAPNGCPRRTATLHRAPLQKTLSPFGARRSARRADAI